jgi:tRNA/rRNA methyltransferase
LFETLALSRRPVIVLVHPQMGENIGMTARAMLNCGLTDLRLVAPRDGWPSESARATSSGATDVIDQAKLYPTLAKAIADCRFVLASGSFERDMQKPVLSPEAAAEAVIRVDHAQDTTGKNSVSAFVFGAERAGLSNDEVALCDAYITVPLNPDYPSLNLAQAVLLISYCWFRKISTRHEWSVAGGYNLDHLGIENSQRATHADRQGLFDHWVQALDQADYYKSPTQRPAMLRNLRHLIHQLNLTTPQINSLRGMIKSLMQRQR